MWWLQLHLLKTEPLKTLSALLICTLFFFFGSVRYMHDKFHISECISLFKMYLDWHGDVTGFGSAISKNLNLILWCPCAAWTYCVWELGGWCLHSGCCPTQSFLSGVEALCEVNTIELFSNSGLKWAKFSCDAGLWGILGKLWEVCRGKNEGRNKS